MNAIFDAQGGRIALGAKLGAGGEGTVYALPSQDRVAKLYHHMPSAERARKIAVMARQASEAITSVAAWPVNTLHAGPGGPLLGLLMPRVQGYRDIHHLYSPAQRKEEFPGVDWPALIQVSQNVAHAFARVHQLGHVIGDVNQSNVVVAPNGTVKLIDCDSFQIHDGNNIYPCQVGVAHFTPPELQGRSFHGVVRTQAHDAFGLAVLIFHLLFMGRHPFVGVFGGRGDLPVERAITEHRFAFGREAARLLMSPPPYAITLAQVPPRVGMLFERAFAPPGSGSRPTAAEWDAALAEMRTTLLRCGMHAGHHFYGTLGCPWCAIEQAGGPDFFVGLAVLNRVRQDPTVDLSAIRKELAALRLPSPNRPVALKGIHLPPRPLPPSVLLQRRVAQALGMAAVFAGFFGLAIGSGFAWMLVFVLTVGWVTARKTGPLERERERRERELGDSTQHLDALAKRWRAEVEPVFSRFKRTHDEVLTRVRKLEGLSAEYQRAKGRLQQDVRGRQLHRFLEQFLISRAQIRGIGAGLTGSLASFGVETAADISYRAVIQVPGIGPSRARSLAGWRAVHERLFVYDPGQGVHPQDTQALERKFRVKGQELQRKVRETLSFLRAEHKKLVAQVPQLERELVTAEKRAAQAMSDAHA